jgi:hypothetical protein
MNNFAERIETALGAMATAPRPLRAYLAQPGPDFEKAAPAEIDQMMGFLLSGNPNESTRVRFSGLLRSWDNAKDPKWTDTARNTTARREHIHKLLKSSSEDAQRIDSLLPFYHLDEPLIVSERHQDWYEPITGVRNYYWAEYVRYLRERRRWNEASILNLDNNTRAIVECLANPESPAAYASRGLVMGYVQSGKTTNFTGVVARAADAGYRLIIILAGTWNILRNQTQRRLDKELLGKELLQNDESYMQQPPADWDEFLEHGADPVQLGHYTWQRLTRPDLDFRNLKAAIDSLEFEKTNKAAPLYDPSNLHVLPAKLLVVKKHSGILSNLANNFKLLRMPLAQLPTLIIDDESDQAGLNTIDPNRRDGETRSETNKSITRLLKLFPRAQYVGYTATPYANSLVNPDDPEDLYPKDFIISLDRPRDYMGVSDFFDPSTAFEDLQNDDYSLPEIAYIRRVESGIGADDDDLKTALRSYVLAGGFKLYREASNIERYKPEDFWHHTMLIHTSSSKGEHAAIANRLESLWLECAFNSPRGLSELEDLWNRDHKKVSAAMGSEIVPASFSELVPYLSKAIKRIEQGSRVFLLVNSDTAEAPDFSRAPVWKIIIGGNKLSRGYTVEGLTVSYYRRVAGTADTLMQMGRWFGFRPGYRDLVRVFLGVKEGRSGDTDLVALFKEVCRMEERFREEIKRYIRKKGAKRITPREIPPLISISGSLPPTARNKMFNAVLQKKNFGGQRSQPTLTPAKPEGLNANIKALETLLTTSKALGRITLGGLLAKDNKSQDFPAVVFEATNNDVVTFLSSYRWLESEYKDSERPADITLQIEFLTKEKHEITKWMILAPQRKNSFGQPLKIQSVGDLTVKERHRAGGRGFQVFGEPPHRAIANFLAGIDQQEPDLKTPNSGTLKLKREHLAVCLLYPVREKDETPSVGYELFFPENSMPFEAGFTVRRNTEKVVV